MLPGAALESKTSLRRYVFLTFSWQLRLKHILLRPLLEKLLPKMLSKSMIPFETSLKKSKKRQAIASAGSEALGSCWLAVGSSGSSWEVFFSENKPPEGAGHRKTMLLKK